MVHYNYSSTFLALKQGYKVKILQTTPSIDLCCRTMFLKKIDLYCGTVGTVLEVYWTMDITD